MLYQGWHQRLNSKGKAKMPFYLLVSLLHTEAVSVQLNMELVSEKKVQRYQKKTYKKLQVWLTWIICYSTGTV